MGTGNEFTIANVRENSAPRNARVALLSRPTEPAVFTAALSFQNKPFDVPPIAFDNTDAVGPKSIRVFYNESVVHREYAPRGQTIDKEF